MTSNRTAFFKARRAATIVSAMLPFAALAAACFDAAALVAAGKALQVIVGAR